MSLDFRFCEREGEIPSASYEAAPRFTTKELRRFGGLCKSAHFTRVVLRNCLGPRRVLDQVTRRSHIAEIRQGSSCLIVELAD